VSLPFRHNVAEQLLDQPHSLFTGSCTGVGDRPNHNRDGVRMGVHSSWRYLPCSAASNAAGDQNWTEVPTQEAND